MVVLTLDAAAGRGLLIYLCFAADRLEEAAFRTFFQPFSVAQTAPFMGQPFPTRTPEMQHRFKSVLHSRLPSAPQRYNTLDFPTENRVPRVTLSPLDTPAKGNAVSLWIPYANRDAARPYWITQSQGAAAPLDTPMFSARLSWALIRAGFASFEHATGTDFHFHKE